MIQLKDYVLINVAMEQLKQYALIGIALVLSVILSIIFIQESCQKNKILKARLSISFVNIFLIILIAFFYDSFIANNIILYGITLGYIILFLLIFTVIIFIYLSYSNQKAASYSQFMQSLNNTSWNVYYICDKKDRFKEISDSLLDELNMKKEDVLGKKAFDVFDQKIRFTKINDTEVTNKELREYYKNFGNTSKGKDEYKREIFFQNYNGQTIVLNLVEKPIYSGGKYRGRLNVGQKKNDQSLVQVEKDLKDINKDLISIQQKFVAALELTSEGIFFNDLDENYIWGNDVMVSDLGLTSNTISFPDYLSLINKEDEAIYRSTLNGLTPERPTYSISYRMKINGRYEFVKEVGKRIFEDESSNVILGYAKKVHAGQFERTNMQEIDSMKSLDDMIVDLDVLYNDRRVFQLVCVNLTTLPDINASFGRSVGNMIMNEYIKKIKKNLLTESSEIYRASGLVFYFTITDTRKMDFLKRMLISDANSLNLAMNYGSYHAELKVNIGVAEATSDGLNKEELIKNCNAAINASLNPNYCLNYAYYRDIKNNGIR